MLTLSQIVPYVKGKFAADSYFDNIAQIDFNLDTYNTQMNRALASPGRALTFALASGESPDNGGVILLENRLVITVASNPKVNIDASYAGMKMLEKTISLLVQHTFNSGELGVRKWFRAGAPLWDFGPVDVGAELYFITIICKSST